MRHSKAFLTYLFRRAKQESLRNQTRVPMSPCTPLTFSKRQLISDEGKKKITHARTHTHKVPLGLGIQRAAAPHCVKRDPQRSIRERVINSRQSLYVFRTDRVVLSVITRATAPYNYFQSFRLLVELRSGTRALLIHKSS